MYKKTLLCAAFISVLAACSDTKNPSENNNGTSTPKTDTSEKPLALNIITTSEINTPEPVVKATIAPKLGLQAWSSHLLLLSDTGKVYSGSTAFGRSEKISDGPYSDVIGLARGFDPAMFLALTNDGKLKAYRENEESGFSQVPLSLSQELRGTFCNTYEVTPDTFAMNRNGKVQLISYEVENGVISLEPLQNPTDEAKPCKQGFELRKLNENTSTEINPAALLQEDYKDDRFSIFELALSDNQVSVTQDEITYPLKVESGMGLEPIGRSYFQVLSITLKLNL